MDEGILVMLGAVAEFERARPELCGVPGANKTYRLGAVTVRSAEATQRRRSEVAIEGWTGCESAEGLWNFPYFASIDADAALPPAYRSAKKRVLSRSRR